MGFEPDLFDPKNYEDLPPDEIADLQSTYAVMTDETLLPVYIQIAQAWLLISALQLCSRHPGVSDYMKTQWELIGRQFQQSIVDLHPEADSLLERGWHTEYDV